jgi:hypothetical protein
MGRFLAVALCAAIVLPACREVRKTPELPEDVRALLEQKADDTIGVIMNEGLPVLFAGLVVFRSDVFLRHSALLDRMEISVLNCFDNAAILLLRGPDIPALLREPPVRKIYYLGRQGSLVRLDPAFEMELLRRFSAGREEEPVTFFIRFREAPREKDAQVVESAGFDILARPGSVWVVAGPLTSLPRLLEYEEIIYYEMPSKVKKL